jgi:hypothetical protein
MSAPFGSGHGPYVDDTWAADYDRVVARTTASSASRPPPRGAGANQARGRKSDHGPALTGTQPGNSEILTATKPGKRAMASKKPSDVKRRQKWERAEQQAQKERRKKEKSDAAWKAEQARRHRNRMGRTKAHRGRRSKAAIARRKTRRVKPQYSGIIRCRSEPVHLNTPVRGVSPLMMDYLTLQHNVGVEFNITLNWIPSPLRVWKAEKPPGYKPHKRSKRGGKFYPAERFKQWLEEYYPERLGLKTRQRV